MKFKIANTIHVLVVGVLLLMASSALAQVTPAGDPAQKALSDLIQTGVLGSMLVIVMYVALKLWQKNNDLATAATAAAEKHRDEMKRMGDDHRKEILELTKEQSRLLAENNLLTKRQIDLMEKVVEKASS